MGIGVGGVGQRQHRGRRKHTRCGHNCLASKAKLNPNDIATAFSTAGAQTAKNGDTLTANTVREALLVHEKVAMDQEARG